MHPSLRAIILPVADIQRSTSFYESLGFQKSRGGAQLTLFELGSNTLGLVPRNVIEEDLGNASAGEPGGCLLFHSVRTRVEVDQVLLEAKEAGATVASEASDNDWGGYNGVFSDPDGHRWSVGWNPEFYRKD